MSETLSPNTVPATEKKPIRWSSIIMWVAIFGLLALLGWGLLEANDTRPEAGESAPEFDLQFFNGYEWEDKNYANLSDMRGNIVVLNFWASWCVECRIEAADLEASWQRYRDQGVIFLGVAHVDVEPKSLQYLEEFNITYPNAPDLGTIISNDYEVTGVPETFIIDRNGEIAHVQIGPMSGAMLNSEIERLLAKGG